MRGAGRVERISPWLTGSSWRRPSPRFRRTALLNLLRGAQSPARAQNVVDQWPNGSRSVAHWLVSHSGAALAIRNVETRNLSSGLKASRAPPQTVRASSTYPSIRPFHDRADAL